jgi:hypothetical protein
LFLSFQRVSGHETRYSVAALNKPYRANSGNSAVEHCHVAFHHEPDAEWGGFFFGNFTVMSVLSQGTAALQLLLRKAVSF